MGSKCRWSKSEKPILVGHFTGRMGSCYLNEEFQSASHMRTNRKKKEASACCSLLSSLTTYCANRNTPSWAMAIFHGESWMCKPVEPSKNLAIMADGPYQR